MPVLYTAVGYAISGHLNKVTNPYSINAFIALSSFTVI